MQILINTGGKGTRLHPLTLDTPKPMLKVKNKPILEYLVEWAKKYEVNEIIMLNGYKAKIIENYFKDGKEYGITILHLNEPYPLGSGGAIKYAKNLIKDRFVYISGDLLCQVNLEKMIDYHKKTKSDFTCAVKESDHPEDSDILKINERNQVIKFISKNVDHENAGNLANSGLCIIEKKIIKLMEEDIFNFENYLYPRIINSSLKMMAYKTSELIKDIGTFERLKMAEELLK